MAEQRPHKHPDSGERIKTLETQVKNIQPEVRDLQQKMESQDHPHSH